MEKPAKAVRTGAKPAGSKAAKTRGDRLGNLLIKPAPLWHAISLDAIEAGEDETTKSAGEKESALKELFLKAKTLYDAEVQKYEKVKFKSASDGDFISSVLRSGTVIDKVSALTLLIQESPLHTLSYLRDHLINGMARKKARREAILAIDAVKDLFGSSLLPEDRKLEYFRDQRLFSEKVTSKHLVMWIFEDLLKKLYFEFLLLLEELSKDPLPYVKNKMLHYITDLLVAKPEQEANLLSLITNKLGDQDRKVASQAHHQLLVLLQKHPAMNLVVVSEAERFLFRPNVGDRARLVAISFLNQVVLSNRGEDRECARRLVDTYFALFEHLVKRIKEDEDALRDREKARKGEKGKKGKGKKGPPKKSRHGARKGGAGAEKPQKTAEEAMNGENVISLDNGTDSEDGGDDAATTADGKNDDGDDRKAGMKTPDGVGSKIMSALLTGVNRAFPYAKIPEDAFQDRLSTLFAISHIGTFHTCVQALTLIFQVEISRDAVGAIPSDRFYRTLYATLLDARLLSFSKHALYLNLLHRAMKVDARVRRVKAFVKRLVQVCGGASPPFICASFYLIGRVAGVHGSVWALMNQPEENEGEEKYVDADEDGEGKEIDAKGAARAETYDWKKRDPSYTNAEKSCLWELCQFSHHYHPTVTLYASTLLSGQSISPPEGATAYDPLQNHTLARFLDRFVYKNPKRATSLYKGASVMQPRALANHNPDGPLFQAGKKRDVVVDSGDGKALAMDDAPVNSEAWFKKGKGSVPVDEAFFYRFFAESRAKESGKLKKAEKKVAESKDVDGSDVGSDAGSLDEDEVWAAMNRSSGVAAGLGGEDDDYSDDFDMDQAMADGVSEGGDSDDDFDMEKAMDEGGDDDDDEFVERFGESIEDDSEPGHAMDDSADMDNDDDDDDDMGAFTFGDDDGLDDDEDEDEEEDRRGKKKQKKGKAARMAEAAAALGYKGDFFAKKAGGGNAFASAEDFESLIDKEGDEEEDEPGRPRKLGPRGRKRRE
ncbi:hypothetical protein HK101_004774 [Irineochytrium annulatum]|nr:hypothetical protein HK101_004774 [Irineochytrium annulatum]